MAPNFLGGGSPEILEGIIKLGLGLITVQNFVLINRQSSEISR